MPDEIIGPAQPDNDTSSISTLPAAENVPEPADVPEHIEELNNLAGDKELVECVRKWASKQVEHFRGQPARIAMMKAGGTMDMADRMRRASLRRDTTSDQNEDTRSNVTSTAYLRAQDTVVAGTSMVFFGDNQELPAQFEPEINSPDYDPTTSVLDANALNMQEQFTFDEDKRIQKCKDFLWTLFKYSNALATIEWERKTAQRKRRKAVAWDLDGKPTAFDFVESERVVTDWPVLREYPLEDVFFDAQIDEPEKWRCWAVTTQFPWEDVAGNQNFLNVDKLNPQHFYQGETDGENVKGDRNQNADEKAIPEPTGLLEIWHVRGVMPIREHKRKGKGKWDASEVPQRYCATFCGKLSDGGAVCLSLTKNPRHDNRWGVGWFHAHRDDKGAYHDGDATRLRSLYTQATTNLNQAFDCVNTIIRAPYVLEGTMETANLKFNRAGKVIKIGRGSKLVQLQIQNTTQITLPMKAELENEIFAVMGADKPVRGEAFLSRTSALEANNALQQALIVIDNQTGYIADQFFSWMLENDAELWAQYGDPELTYYVMQGQERVGFEPAKLTAAYKVKVTAVSRYRNNILKRREVNNFIMAGGLAFMSKYMDEAGGREFCVDSMKVFGFDRPERYFPKGGGYDATMRAVAATRMMLNQGQWVEPHPDENQRAWLAIMEPFADEYERLPEDEMNPDRLRLIRAHIEMRKQFETANDVQKQALAGGAGGMEGGEQGMMGPGQAPSQLPGRAGGESQQAMEGTYGAGSEEAQ